jgi:hypothetical protein
VNFIDGWILLACSKNSSSSFHHLKRRGYNDKVIESGFSKVSENNRNNLLEYKEKKINKRVPLVLTYHPSLEKIAGIVVQLTLQNILYSFPVAIGTALAMLVTTWFTLADRR